MIREERDPTFWNLIAEHPEVRPHMELGVPFSMTEVIGHPAVLPLASARGGFLFYRLDGVGRVWDLHALYTPDAWGREVAEAMHEALLKLFSIGAQVITAYEVDGWWRSRPPLSHGWRPAGPFESATELVAAKLRTWVLTREAWLASPVGKRICRLS